MCVTLRNAVEVLDHRAERTTVIGHTRTRHHIGNLSPGDWWFPGPDPLPHTVTAVRRRDGHIVLTDQFGIGYPYPTDVVIATAVPDPRLTLGPTRAA